ncbi:ubiquitin-conjugating enzyme E2 [Phanerochaete sordida]|uniref:E2 ubiquitin-conjugating enzyme n=1 Tax=Phanerochaete sordida TaxID=48140 RepID=A0A9P3GQW4_9APHY|nr:ubiquitin-conjugating enzyme E2 [Phanerochaete sordida]
MPPPLVSTTTLKRIHREIADVKKEDLGNITLCPTNDNLFQWKATIPGPEGSVYEGGVFNVDITLGHDYPFSAPHMTFKTRIYHMNINERGGICIDILKHNWSPALSLFKVILSLSSLLTDPNPRDPLVPSIATEYVRNREQHDRTARQWTQLYARPPPPASAAVPNSRAKGKARAPATPTVLSAPSSARATPRATPGASRQDEPIVIEDSDNESGTPLRATAKRKRAAEESETTPDASPRANRRRTGRGSAAPAPPDSEVIVIED